MKKIVTVLLLFLSCILNGQDGDLKKIDSLVRIISTSRDDTLKCLQYNKISNLYLYVNISKGIYYADKGIALATQLKWTKGIGIGYVALAKHLISKGDFVRALKNLDIAEEIFSRTNDHYNIAGVYNQLGILKANQNKFHEALTNFFKAIKNFESTNQKNSKPNIAYVYENIANIYNATGNYDKSLENYTQAIDMFRDIGNEESSMAMNIAGTGMVYQKQHKYKKALDALKEAETILIEVKAESSLAFINSWMGSVYLSLSDYDLSLSYSNKALKTAIVMGDEVLKASIIQNIGYAHIKKGMSANNTTELDLGFDNVSKSLVINKKLGNIETLINDYRYLSEYYEFKKDYKNSLEAYKNYAMYNDSIYNTRNKQSLQNLQDERTIEVRDKEIEVSKLNLESKEKQKWFLISGILFCVIIGTMLFYQSRNRKKINETLQILNKELEQANNIKTRFFSILNHDLRTPVSNLIHFLHLKTEHPELLNEESRTRMEYKTISAAENLLVSMEDLLLWCKGQMQHFKTTNKQTNVAQLFEELEKHFSSSEHVTINFENSGNISVYTDSDYLKTIMRNLTSNAIKALEKSHNPTITWKAWTEHSKIYLSIMDNGSGAVTEQFKPLYNDNEVMGIKTGLGLHLIRDLAKAIDCTITVHSTLNKGTIFILVFKI